MIYTHLWQISFIPGFHLALLFLPTTFIYFTHFIFFLKHTLLRQDGVKGTASSLELPKKEHNAFLQKTFYNISKEQRVSIPKKQVINTTSVWWPGPHLTIFKTSPDQAKGRGAQVVLLRMQRNPTTRQGKLGFPGSTTRRDFGRCAVNRIPFQHLAESWPSFVRRNCPRLVKKHPWELEETVTGSVQVGSKAYFHQSHAHKKQSTELCYNAQMCLRLVVGNI